ncbi:MAG TPA: TPM domain-containing protein [Hanamia sp.]|nr:TPM domain-containing protein [Hanamia sp.]
MKIFFTFLLLLVFLSPPDVKAQNVPDYVPFKTMTPQQLAAYRQSIWDTLPAAIGWVNDFGDLFTQAQENSLERTLEHFEKATSVEICIVTVDSNMVAENKFSEFSYRLMKKWGIGKISKSNGIVICICKDYRRMCVTTDFGIDRYVNESDKNKLINRDFAPYFAKNDYYDGTSVGLSALLEKIDRHWEQRMDVGILDK